tara:strand:+ start:2272 stop:2577 length:306 start_codon:yes stop_codon:yes gene_type:complete
MAKDKSKKIIDNIKNLQNNYLISLKGQAEALKSAATSLLEKIDNEGTDGFYSINSDCLKYAEQVWRYSTKLSELKMIETDLKRTNSKKAKDKSNNELDKNK